MTGLIRHWETTPGLDEVGGRTARRLGVATIVVAFGGFGGWAALAPLNSAAVARGEVKVESYRKTIQHMDGGIV
ncbi:MAG TPA: HlyD family type I secretion periplasmic adaptor subunit, partial [Magnetospirillum sp.]|nr:HlyD family type I secretion periplasmic adaptor subunit [Magnetospirillum sp.]